MTIQSFPLRHAWLPILTECGPPPTAAQREVAAGNAAAQVGMAQFNACKQEVRVRPELAALLPHLPDPVTGQYSMAQMTNETRPTFKEATLFVSWFDAMNAP